MVAGKPRKDEVKEDIAIIKINKNEKNTKYFR